VTVLFCGAVACDGFILWGGRLGFGALACDGFILWGGRVWRFYFVGRSRVTVLFCMEIACDGCILWGGRCGTAFLPQNKTVTGDRPTK
jgi:hypothetical protein